MPDTEFPKWFYGPKGAAEVFESAEEVPEGWVEHPSKLDGAPQDPAPIQTPQAPAGASVDVFELDDSGTPWDASRNTPDKGKTQSGLWQLRPGQSRPVRGAEDAKFDL